MADLDDAVESVLGQFGPRTQRLRPLRPIPAPKNSYSPSAKTKPKGFYDTYVAPVIDSPIVRVPTTILNAGLDAVAAGGEELAAAIQGRESRVRLQPGATTKGVVDSILDDLQGKSYDTPSYGRHVVEAIKGGAQLADLDPETGSDISRVQGATGETKEERKVFAHGNPGLSTLGTVGEVAGEVLANMAADPLNAGALKLAKEAKTVGDLAKIQKIERAVGATQLPGMAAGAVRGAKNAADLIEERGIESVGDAMKDPEVMESLVNATLSGTLAGVAARSAVRPPSRIAKIPEVPNVADALGPDRVADVRVPEREGTTSAPVVGDNVSPELLVRDLQFARDASQPEPIPHFDLPPETVVKLEDAGREAAVTDTSLGLEKTLLDRLEGRDDDFARGYRQYFVERGDEAFKRLMERSKKGEAFGGAPVIEGIGALRDLADYGASKIAVGAIDFASFSREMIKEFGEKIQPHLERVWQEAQGLIRAKQQEQPQGMEPIQRIESPVAPAPVSARIPTVTPGAARPAAGGSTQKASPASSAPPPPGGGGQPPAVPPQAPPPPQPPTPGAPKAAPQKGVAGVLDVIDRAQRAFEEGISEGGGDPTMKPGGDIDIGTNLERVKAPDELKARMAARGQVLQEIESRSEVRPIEDVVAKAGKLAKEVSPEDFLRDVIHKSETKQQLKEEEVGYLRQIALKAAKDEEVALQKFRNAEKTGDKKQTDSLRAEYDRASLRATAATVLRDDATSAYGRALQSLSARLDDSGVSSHTHNMWELSRMLRKAGLDSAAIDDLKKKYNTDPKSFAEEFRRKVPQSKMEKVTSLFAANLLSPISVSRAVIGNLVHGGLRLAEAGVGAKLAAGGEKVGLPKGDRAPGDVGAMVAGVSRAFPEALAKLKSDLKSIAKAQDVFDPKASPVENVQAIPPLPGKAGHILHTMPKLLSVFDKFYRPLFASAESYRLAYTDARKRGLTGEAADSHAQKFLANIDAGNNPEALEHVLAYSKRGVAQGGGPFTTALKQFAVEVPAIRFPVPFFTSGLVLGDVAIDMTPAGALRAIYKGKTGQWTPDQVYGRLAMSLLGTTAASVIPSLVAAGYITGSGPSDPKEKKELMDTGWRPYSLKLGDTYYSGITEAVEPLGNALRLAADVTEIGLGKKGETKTKFAQLATAVRDGLGSYRFIDGLMELFNAITNQDGKDVPQYLSKLLGVVLVPSTVEKIATAIDPKYRNTKPETALEHVTKPIASRVPGLTFTLPEKRTATGDAATRPTGAAAGISRVISPVQPSPEREGKEVTKELLRIGYIPSQPKREIRLPNGQRLRLDDNDYAEVQNAHKTASEEVRRLMSQSSYRVLPDTVEQGGSDSKEAKIRQVFDRHRDGARKKVYARLRIKRKKTRKSRARKGRRKVARRKVTSGRRA